MVSEEEVVASMACSHRGGPRRRGLGLWCVSTPEGTQAERAGVQLADLGGQDVFQREKKRQRRRSRLGARGPKKILAARGERSERPVALPTAPARLIKSGCAADPAAGDLGRGQGVTSGDGPRVGLCRQGRAAKGKAGSTDLPPPSVFPSGQASRRRRARVSLAAPPQCSGARGRQSGTAEVGLLALGVARPVATAAVGEAGLAGERVRLLD